MNCSSISTREEHAMKPAAYRPLVVRKWLALILTLTSGGAASAAGQELPIPEIPYEKFVLDNGLTVVIHEDHRRPSSR
jgi:hypothetical protein